MKKKSSIKSLTLKKSNIAQLNEKEIGMLNGGSTSISTITLTHTVFTIDDDCTSIYCIPPL